MRSFTSFNRNKNMTDKLPLVSIVVPSFNNETHTASTLASIINQDYENLEIIFVNDASTDNTLSIAEKVLNDSGRIYKIINHEKNSGVSTARNTGFDASNGEYICFCDGDDLLSEGYVSLLLSKILENDCDISFCGLIDRFTDGKDDKLLPVELPNKYFFSGEEILNMRLKFPVISHLCCMMFKKIFLLKNFIRFHDGCSAFEDIEFQLKTLCHAKKVSFVSDCLYIYNHDSEMGSIRDNNTDEKKLRRYIHSSQAHERVAEYLSLHAPSERVKLLADNFLMPEAVIRKFTIEARKNDREAYRNLCQDKKLREILKRSRKVLLKKPEIFLKSFAILLMPDLYFRLRK